VNGVGEQYLVKIARQAESQLQEIADYIAQGLQNPYAAMKTINAIEQEIGSLANFPNRVALVEEEPWHSAGLHKLPVRNFLIYFWVNEAQKKVQVISVVYARRNQKHQLEQMDIW